MTHASAPLNKYQSTTPETGHASKYISKAEIKILSQLIGDKEGHYRIRANSRVYYLIIMVDVFDEDTMLRPYLLIPALPNLPNTLWTTASISRAPNGELVSCFSNKELRGIEDVWHHEEFDILSLKRKVLYRPNVSEVEFRGGVAIAKIACWEWEIPRIENETRAYSITHGTQIAGAKPIAPEFLGHITENGRVIGFLMEKVEGRSVGISDLLQCEDLVKRVHQIGIVHGDVNRYNFIARENSPHMVLVDFEHAENFNEEAAKRELESLPLELKEETGRGGTSRLSIDDSRQGIIPGLSKLTS